MAEFKLHADTRDVVGKQVKRIRQEGFVPAVVYGGTLSETMSVKVEQRALKDVLNFAGRTNLINLTVDEGGVIPSLVREVQRDVLSHDIIHVDFQAVRMDETIRVEVPIQTVGDSEPARSGEAVVSNPLNTLLIEALPQDIPSTIEVDISALETIGDSILVADLELPENVEIHVDPDVAIFTLQPLRDIEEVEALEEPVPVVSAEPELAGEEVEEEELEAEEVEEEEAEEEVEEEEA